MFHKVHSIDHSTMDEGGQNRATIEIESMHIRLTVIEDDKIANFSFTFEEWVKFIVGTVHVDDFLIEQGLGGLLRPVGRLPSIPEYQ